MNDDASESIDGDYRINNEKTTTIESFEYIRKIGYTANNDSRLDAEVVVPLKYLNNFWISLDLPLINFETELDLS